MQDLSIDIKTMPQAFRGYHLLLVITCNQTNFTIAVPLRDQTAQTVREALIYKVIYLSWPENQGILFFLYFSNIANELDIFHGFPP